MKIGPIALCMPTDEFVFVNFFADVGWVGVFTGILFSWELKLTHYYCCETCNGGSCFAFEILNLLWGGQVLM